MAVDKVIAEISRLTFLAHPVYGWHSFAILLHVCDSVLSIALSQLLTRSIHKIYEYMIRSLYCRNAVLL